MKTPQTRPIIAVLSLLFCFIMIWDVLHMPDGHDKTIAVQVLSAITTLLGMILAYYFGANHKGSTSTETEPKTNVDMQKQVFWGIHQMEDLIDDQNSPFHGMMAKEIPGLSANYEILLDDTNQAVLAVNTLTSVSLTFGYGVVPSEPTEFIGNKPRRPR